MRISIEDFLERPGNVSNDVYQNRIFEEGEHMANADRLHYKELSDFISLAIDHANMVEERSRELSLVKTKLEEAQMWLWKIDTGDCELNA